MAPNKALTVEGYSFTSPKDVELAKAELARIKQLEEKINYNNPKMVMLVYDKAIENKLFKTPVGFDFMKKMQRILLDSDIPPEQIRDIPVNRVYAVRDNASEAVEKFKTDPKLEKARKRQETRTKKGLIIANIALLVMVLLMLWISTTGSNPTVIDYEKKLQNRYATWEKELQERENTIREKERELLIQNN